MALGLVLMTSSANGALIAVTSGDYTGSRTVSSGQVTGTGTWTAAEGGLKLSWNIAFDSNTGLWTYRYTFQDEDLTPIDHELSHWILQVSDTFTASNIKTGTVGVGSSGGLDTYGQSNSNPNLPGSLYGIKFDVGTGPGGVNAGTYVLVTDRAPVWGSFYAKDGNSQPATSAWNVGFTGNDTTVDDLIDPSTTRPVAGTTNFSNWVPTPDTTTTPPPNGAAPEPSSIALAAVGLLGFGAAYRRRKRVQQYNA